MNNRIDRAIEEVTEVVERVMGTHLPLPWPTTTEKYLQRPGQITAASDREMDGEVRGLGLSKPEESEYVGDYSQRVGSQL